MRRTGKKAKVWFCLFQKIFCSRKSRRTRRLRFAVIGKKTRCSLLFAAWHRVFSLCATFCASPFSLVAQIHSFLFRRPCGARGKRQKRGFAFFKEFGSRKFFQADERIFRDLKTTPRARKFFAGRGVFLCGALFRGTPPFCAPLSLFLLRLRVSGKRQKCDFAFFRKFFIHANLAERDGYVFSSRKFFQADERIFRD